MQRNFATAKGIFEGRVMQRSKNITRVNEQAWLLKCVLKMRKKS